MNCEICEKPIVIGKKVKIEGSIVVVCDECSSYGKVVDSVDIKRENAKKAKYKETTPETFNIEEEWALVDNYQVLIKNVREKLKFKQEDLAKLINEPASLIHRIETGKVEPSPQVGKKIARKLSIQLYEKQKEVDTKVQTSSEELTLGDVVIVRKKND